MVVIFCKNIDLDGRPFAAGRELLTKSFRAGERHKKGGYPITGQPRHLLSLIV
jgi:hypothetical protein